MCITQALYLYHGELGISKLQELIRQSAISSQLIQYNCSTLLLIIVRSAVINTHYSLISCLLYSWLVIIPDMETSPVTNGYRDYRVSIHLKISVPYFVYLPQMLCISIRFWVLGCTWKLVKYFFSVFWLHFFLLASFFFFSGFFGKWELTPLNIQDRSHTRVKHDKYILIFSSHHLSYLCSWDHSI